MSNYYASRGKYYLNGTAVQFAVPPKLTADQIAERQAKAYEAAALRKEKGLTINYRLGFKQKMKLYDAITYQHFQAAADPNLYHLFLTATYNADNVPGNPNKQFSCFLDKAKKAGYLNYAWVRELTKAGTPHYHFTMVGPKRPIYSTKEWNLNKAWCDSRGYFSKNAMRSSINPKTGRNQMVINNLISARKYIAKYMSKAGQEDQAGVRGRIYAVSNDLVFNPVNVTGGDAIGIALHPFYGDGRDLYRGDYCTIGGVRPDFALKIYEEFLAIESRKKSSYKARKKSKHHGEIQGFLNF